MTGLYGVALNAVLELSSAASSEVILDILCPRLFVSHNYQYIYLTCEASFTLHSSNSDLHKK